MASSAAFLLRRCVHCKGKPEISYWHLDVAATEKGEMSPRHGYALGSICWKCLKKRVSKGTVGDFFVFLNKMIPQIPPGGVGVFEVTGANGEAQKFLLAVHRISP